MTKDELLNMDLHEVKSIPCKSHDVTVMRVFGGWVYSNLGWDNQMDILTSSSMCFVPEVVDVYAKVQQ